MEVDLTHEAFTQHTNTPFMVQLDEENEVSLELTEISDLKVSSRQEEFAVVFRGPLDKFLGQGTRLLSHESMGQFELFLVPIRHDAQGVYYEAVFNRVREQING